MPIFKYHPSYEVESYPKQDRRIEGMKMGQKEDKAMRNVTVAATQTILVQSFDLDEIEEYRRSWGVWRDRRQEMYGILTTHGK